MVRLANSEDTMALSLMLKEMTLELWPEHAATEDGAYFNEILRHFNDPRDVIFVDSRLRGFFIVRDEAEEITPNYHRYNGMRLYIGTDYRGGRLLKQFYDALFKHYPEGEIWGLTEINSKHIQVLDKRHECIAKIYKLRRT